MRGYRLSESDLRTIFENLEALKNDAAVNGISDWVDKIEDVEEIIFELM